jgi:hypothetical protein
VASLIKRGDIYYCSGDGYRALGKTRFVQALKRKFPAAAEDRRAVTAAVWPSLRQAKPRGWSGIRFYPNGVEDRRNLSGSTPGGHATCYAVVRPCDRSVASHDVHTRVHSRGRGKPTCSSLRPPRVRGRYSGPRLWNPT